MGISKTGGPGHGRAPGPRKSQFWLVIAGCAAVVLGVQVGVLMAVPTGWRMVVSSLLTAAVFAGWFAIVVRSARRGKPADAPTDAPTAPTAHAGWSAGPEAQEPSARMLLACELARRGTPAVWIAAECDLPVALSELVVADERGTTQHPGPTHG